MWEEDFEIYSHPIKGYASVKVGWSAWWAWFFTLIWAFSNSLWLIGFVYLFLELALIFLAGVGIFKWLIIGILVFYKYYVSKNANALKVSALEKRGYVYCGDVVATSHSSALALARSGQITKRTHRIYTRTFDLTSFSPISISGSYQQVMAVAGLTWKAALRFKLFLVIAVLLILAVVGLPLVIKDDGTAQGFTQIILTYTLSAITALLGLSTLWLSCGTLARDIEECQIQVVATKPIARWQIWIGKWLGIVSLNFVLLAISGACVYGLLQWRATKLPAAEQKNLREQVLVARGAAKEKSFDPEIDAEAARILQERLKSSPVTTADLPEVQKQIREQVKAELQVVPAGYTSRPWQIDLGFAKSYLKDRPLQLRVKFNPANHNGAGTFVVVWQVGDPTAQQIWQSEPMSLAPDTFHEFQIPPNLLDTNGVLTIVAANANDTALLFPLEDGMTVLYPEGGFEMNFVRGLGIIFCWMALLAALGLAAASFLSFPVAAFFSLAMLVVILSSGTLADAVESGTVVGGNEETGVMGHSGADAVLIPMFKGMLSVTRLVENFSPIDSLSTGRAITWGDLGLAFGQIVLLIGGIIAVFGIILFQRRELATAQGTQ